MNCNEIIFFIDDYFDSTADPDIRNEIEKHLSRCFNCSSRYKTVSSYHEQIRNFSLTIDNPADILKEISDELSGEKKTELPPQEKKSFFKKIFRNSQLF